MSALQSKDVYDYLIKKYKEFNLLDANGEKTTPDGCWDPYIYPDEGHIPYCKSCQTDYEAFKATKNTQTSCEVDVDHTSGCLWYEYFTNKILSINPNAKIARSNAIKKPIKKIK